MGIQTIETDTAPSFGYCPSCFVWSVLAQLLGPALSVLGKGLDFPLVFP